MLPHWNVESFGEPVRVVAYTNCDEAELILNGRSLGRKSVSPYTPVEWQVDYEEGRIEAVGYVGGTRVVSDVNETAGKPEKLVLKLENSISKAGDVAIVTCYTTDSCGRLVPNASPTVEFSANPIGKVISTGSDICDHTPLNSPKRKMREGYISIAVGVSTEEGKYSAESGVIELYASAEGIKGAKLKISFGK